MSTFERRQRLLSLLEDRPGMNVAQLASRLGVPDEIVRNDLRALAEGRQPVGHSGTTQTEPDPGCDPLFAAQARANAAAKLLMARWAADLVKDHDTILLDASTTVYYMARYLRNRRHLTIVTNGLEVARLLGQEPTNKVIMPGGVVGRSGISVTGLMNEDLLCRLNIKTAFVSCAGFAPETGLGEPDADEAHAKRQMVRCAETVIALIDATKFGKPQRAIFAEPAQISRIFSDGSLDPRWIDALEQMGVPVTICDDRKAFATNPQAERGEAHERYRIGFANLGAQVPFALEVQQGLEQAAAHVSNIIDLVMADNQLSASIALEVAGSLIASNVDLAIEFQIDQQANEIIMARFRDAGIPVIAVDIPMHGATFFGVDNYRSGHMAGVAIGRWVAEHWDAQCDRVILMEEPRAGQTPAGRLRGQLEGLQSVVGQIPPAKVIHLDCSNVADVARVRVGNLLPELPGRHLAFLSINDDVALGALQAIRDAGREEDVVAVGQGATRHGRAEIRRPGTRLIGATAFRPETYGPQLLDIAINILRHQPVPPAVYIDHVFITAENVDEYYPDD